MKKTMKMKPEASVIFNLKTEEKVISVMVEYNNPNNPTKNFTKEFTSTSTENNILEITQQYNSNYDILHLVGELFEKGIPEYLNINLEKAKIFYTKALELAKKDAELGDLSAMLFLGAIYEEGKCVNQDKKEAIKWYTKIANKGYVEIMFYLGILYESEDTPQGKKEAIKWYTKAAELGCSDSMNNLGLIYCYSEKNLDLGKIWFEKSANLGNNDAKENLKIVNEALTKQVGVRPQSWTERINNEQQNSNNRSGSTL